MRMAIYGAGALGTVLGAYIARSGTEIDLISRNREHIAGLKASGARIGGTVRMTVPVRALLPEEMTGKYDLVFLLTKQNDNAAVVRTLLPFLAEDGAVCTMQNGLPEISVAAVIGENRTFGCSIAWGATMIGGGECELTSEPDAITFGLGTFAPEANGAKLAEIGKILGCMGKVEIEDNFIGARWAKLLINSSFSGISTVAGVTFGEAARNKKSRLCIQRTIKECIDVAAAAGIRIAPVQGKNIGLLLDYRNRLKEAFGFALLPLLIKKHRLLKASMLQDLENGKKCEVDAINGIVCDFGKEYGVPTPCNATIRSILHEIENGTRVPGMENIDCFKFPRCTAPAARFRKPAGK